MNGLMMIVIIGLFVTVAILFAGIISMGRGGEYDQIHSTQLMFARVSAQGITALLIFIALHLANN